jgi:hypothetical protein
METLALLKKQIAEETALSQKHVESVLYVLPPLGDCLNLHLVHWAGLLFSVPRNKRDGIAVFRKAAFFMFRRFLIH